MKKLSLILAFVLVMLSLASCGSAGYEAPVKNYFSAIQNENPEKMYKAVYDPFYIEYALEERDLDEDETDELLDECKDMVKDAYERLEDNYGKNIKITYKLEDVRKFTKADVNYLGTYLEDEYDYDAKKVQDVVVITATSRVIGEEDNEAETAEAVVIKVSGKWYYSQIFSGLSDVKSAIREAKWD